MIAAVKVQSGGNSKKFAAKAQLPTHIMGIAGGLILWEAAYLVTGGNGFAHFWDVIWRIIQLASHIDFWLSVGITVILTLGGLFGGVALAVVVGVPLAWNQVLERETRWMLLFARSVPSVALLPLLMASFGSRTILVGVFVVWLVTIKMVFFVIRGVRDIDRSLAEQAKLMCIGPIRKFLLIQFPAASSIILTGARLSIGLAYGAVVLAGLLAGTPGLGRDISMASFAGETASVLAYTVVAAFAGLGMFWLLQALEKRVVVWRNVA